MTEGPVGPSGRVREMNAGVKNVNIFAGRVHGLGEAVGNLLVDGFHLLALFAIGGTIFWAAVPPATKPFLASCFHTVLIGMRKRTGIRLVLK